MESNKKNSKTGSVFRLASGDATIRAYENLNQYINDSYTKPPPELTELFGKVPHLGKLAQLLHSLFATTEEKPLSRKSAELAELSTRHLINEYITQTEMSVKADKSLGNAKSMVDYAALLAQNPTDITLARLQILELQRQIDEQASQLQNVLKENRDLEKENEKLNDEKNKLQNKLNLTINQHKDEISQKRYEYSKLEDNKQIVEDQLKLNKDEISRNSKLIESLKDELEVSNKENEACKERIQQKNQMINALRTELKKKEIELEETELRNAKDRELLSTSLLTQSRLFEEKSNSAMRKLARHIKQQKSEIDLLSGANHKATDVIGKQNQLLDKYEEQLETEIENNNTLSQELTDMKEENDQLKEELEDARNEINTGNNELYKLREIVESSIANLAPQYMITEDQLPETCKELASTRIDPETAKTLQKLNATAEGLAKFSTDLIRTGKGNLEFLKDSPIRLSQTEKGDILNEMERINAFLETISYAGIEEDKAVSYLVDPQSKFELDDSPETPLSFVLAAIISKLREFLEGMIGELSTVRNVLPAFDCSDYQLPTAVAEYIQQMQPVFQQLLQVIGSTLHYHGDTQDIFQCLCKYIEESSNLINILDEDVRPLINYSGKVTEMGPHLASVVAEMKEIVDNAELVQKRALTEVMIQADKDKAEFERQIDELNDNSKKQEKVNNSLKKQLEQVAADLQIARNQIEDLNVMKQETDKTIEVNSMNIQALNDTLTRLNNENQRLDTTLKERTKAMEIRMQQAVEKERENGELALQRESQKFTLQAEILEKQISDLQKKLQKEKANVQNAVQMYNAQSIEHQTMIKKLEHDKEDLSTTIESVRQEPAKEIEKLQYKLADAKMKNKELLAEVTRLRQATAANQTQTQTRRSILVNDPSMTSREVSGLDASFAKDDSKFVAQLGEILNSFIEADIKWTRGRVLKTVKALVQNNGKEQKSKPSVWSSWADELLHKTKRKYIGGISDSEMRQQIGDLTIAAANRTKLIDIIQILRDEKTALLKNSEMPELNVGQSLKSLSLIALFVSTINAKKECRSPSRYVKTEASQAAVRSNISMLN